MTAPVASPTTEPLAITDAAARKAATPTPTPTNSGTGDLTSSIVEPKACDSRTAGSTSTAAAKASSAATTAAGSALDDNRKNRLTHWHPAVPPTSAPAQPGAKRPGAPPC